MPGKAKHWSWQFFVSTEEVIEGKKKIKATLEMASKLTFSKHNLMLERADLFNKSSRRDASVEEEEFGVEKQEENANEDCELSDDDILFEDD
uniref:Uncharacterized protein n=1 Tax=Ditylenchus dipsaci TaxID=166011 RepID=A0A915CZ67_9BILA